MGEVKVIFLCYSLNVGGAERRIAALANRLVEMGAKVRIALLDEPAVKFPLNPAVAVDFLDMEGRQWDLSGNVADVNIVKLDVPNRIGIGEWLKMRWCRLAEKSRLPLLGTELFLRRKYTRKIRKYLSEYQDWKIVSFMSYCNVATMMALEGLANHAAFAECTSPEIEFPGENHPMNILKRRFYPRAEGAFFQTEEERDFYTYLDCRKWVIPNPLHGTFPERFDGVRRKEIVAFARMDKDKNFTMLIDVFAKLAAEYPDYVLSFYGEGKEKEHLMKYSASKGLSDRILFHGFDISLHGKIRDCAMFVSTSNREGLSNSMLEAMAIGLPCVCTDCPAGGARMMIKPYENGLLVPVRDRKALYAAMKELIDNPELAEKLSRNCVKIKDELEIGRIAAKWLDAIKELEA